MTAELYNYLNFYSLACQHTVKPLGELDARMDVELTVIALGDRVDYKNVQLSQLAQEPTVWHRMMMHICGYSITYCGCNHRHGPYNIILCIWPHATLLTFLQVRGGWLVRLLQSWDIIMVYMYIHLYVLIWIRENCSYFSVVTRNWGYERMLVWQCGTLGWVHNCHTL